MSDIDSFEILDQEIQKAGGTPVVLQALWDGDTSGWYLILSLYTKNPSISRDLVWHYMGCVQSYHGKSKEEFAKELAAKAVKKYGLEFYFPSPDDADDDCPDWTERDKATPCTDCGKLILPDSDSVLPKEICFHCHLERERNRELIEDKPQEYGVSQYFCKGRKYEGMRSTGYMENFAMFPYISETIRQQIGKEGVTVLTVEKDELLNLSEKMEARLDVLAQNYRKSLPHERNSKMLNMMRDQTYKGKHYRLDSLRDKVHEEMAELLYAYNRNLQAISEKGCFKFFIKTKGYSYRDDVFMRFIRFNAKGHASIDRIHEHYKKFLSREQVLGTLQKLERFGCVQISEHEVRLTTTGKYL